jgi:hypothetical protein
VQALVLALQRRATKAVPARQQQVARHQQRVCPAALQLQRLLLVVVPMPMLVLLVLVLVPLLAVLVAPPTKNELLVPLLLAMVASLCTVLVYNSSSNPQGPWILRAAAT